MENNQNKEPSRFLTDEKGRFLPGTPGGPGRPKGISIKDRVRQWLEEHPDDMGKFVEHFVKKNRDLAWQMLEGRPAQDVTSGGEKINPIPIYGGKSVHPDDSNGEAVRDEKENT